jgi:probable F420-dependent oxidoreductase
MAVDRTPAGGYEGGMRFSFSLPILRDRTLPDPYRQTYELARLAEGVGFDTATTGHHHFMPGNLADPLTFLATVAARTERLRVATGILQLPVHNPVRVAEQVATVDELSGGRVSLGVGLGWWPLEYEVHGSSFAERGARMTEALEILRLVWADEDVAYDGRFWSFPRLTVHPRPIQRPGPPLWVAGVADSAVRRAARLGDAWLCGPVQSLAKAQSCLRVYRDACAAAGRPGDWILRRYTWIGADHRDVEDRVLPAYVDGLLEHWRESAEDDAEKDLFRRLEAGEDVPAAEVAADRLLWGDPDHVIGQIERYRELTGCDHLHAAFGTGLPGGAGAEAHMGGFEQIAEMVRLFGREVIPAFPA